MAKKNFQLNVFSERCKECGICFEFCPKNNLRPAEDGTPEMIDHAECTGCRLCEYMCPDFAIQLFTEEDKDPQELSNYDPEKKYRFVNIKIVGDAEDYKISLGKQKNK